MNENICNVKDTPSDSSNTTRTDVISEYRNHIMPKIRNLIGFIYKVSEKLEVKYFNFAMDRCNRLYSASTEDLYSSREIIRDCITTVLSDQKEKTTIVDYIQDIFAIQDFCGKFYEEVVKVTDDEKSDGMISAELYVSYLSGELRGIIMELVKNSNRLFYTIYKFPYVLCNFKSISNTISILPNIVTCPNADPENAIIALSIILLKTAKSEKLSWIVCKGLRSHSVVFDEAMVEIIDKLNG